jgi:hypothetical protein
MNSKSALDVRQGFEQKMKATPEFLRANELIDFWFYCAVVATL